MGLQARFCPAPPGVGSLARLCIADLSRDLMGYASDGKCIYHVCILLLFAQQFGLAAACHIARSTPAVPPPCTAVVHTHSHALQASCWRHAHALGAMRIAVRCDYHSARF